MKCAKHRKGKFFLAAMVVLLVIACDLTATNLVLDGPVTLVGDRAKIPVEFTLSNDSGDVGYFKISAEYLPPDSATYFLVPIDILDAGSLTYTNDLWYGYIDSMPGSTSEQIKAMLDVRYKDWEGIPYDAVDVRVVVDSCASEEFMPDYCRIEEPDETNNTSNVLNVTIP